MNVSLTDEQLAWQAAVRGLAEAHAVTPAQPLPAADDPAAWAAVTSLGLPSLRSRTDSDDQATGVEAALAAEQLGRHLCTTPALGQALIAVELLDAVGAADVLAEVTAGDARIAPAVTQALGDAARVDEDGFAYDSAGADRALAIRPSRDGGPGLALVPLTRPAVPGLDLTRELRPFRAGTDAEPVGGPVDPTRWAQAHAFALTMVAADLLGVMGSALDDAVAHASARAQFGVPIGTFQAIQHLLADAAVQVEGARSCVWHAAWAVDHADPESAVLAARTAKAYCSRAGVTVVEASVQVFAGLAITWEHPSHLRLRRTHLDRQLLGSEDVHYREIAASRLSQRLSVA